MKSVYIHIPFCKQICSYCDFPKMICNDAWYEDYFKALRYEIKKRYKKEKVKTIYFGGGTPSVLPIKYFNELMSIIKDFKLTKETEITLECNIGDLSEEKVISMKKFGVNRISFGVQTFNKYYQVLFGREHQFVDLKKDVELLRKYEIENINFDLIYAIPRQTLEELKNDLDYCMSLKPKHMSMYSLIIEPHTKLYLRGVEPVDEDLDRTMYDFVRIYLKGHNFKQYEISNYAQKDYASNHNLTYWLHNEYYGFGLGAASFLSGEQINNTKSLTEYINQQYVMSKKILSIDEQMSYDMILGLRLREGISKSVFYEKYHRDIEEVFDVRRLLETDTHYTLHEEDVYISNDIIKDFVL